MLVGPDAVRPLRAAVLRPGRPAAESVFPGDDDDATVHVAAVDSQGGVLAVGSALPDAPPWPIPATGHHAAVWRIRGMAVAEEARNCGLGGRVLDRLLREVAARPGGEGTVVWCNARLRAVPLYERAGFVAAGPDFDDPHLGPHRPMLLVTA